jgi:hypothetical protein
MTIELKIQNQSALCSFQHQAAHFQALYLYEQYLTYEDISKPQSAAL